MKHPVLTLLFFLLAISANAQQRRSDSLLLISLRQDLSHTQRFSPAPQICWMKINPNEDPECLSVIDEATLLQVVRGKNVLILIHGMGTRFPRMIRYYRSLAHYPLPYDQIIGIAWPGGAVKRSRLSNGLLYVAASSRAKKAGKILAPLLEALAAESNTHRVAIFKTGRRRRHRGHNQTC